MKVKPISVRRKVNILKKPTPTYVSLVDHAATQTPFSVVKRGPTSVEKKDEAAMAFKRTNKKQTHSPANKARARKSSSTAPSSVSVYKLSFQQDTFKTEKSVRDWLKKNQWDNDYLIEDEGGEFIVKSKTAKPEDHFDLREVPLNDDGSISALVGKMLGTSELTTKAGKKKTDPTEPSTLGNAAVNEDAADPEGDGTDAAGLKADNADDDDDADGSDDDNSDDADDDADDDDADGDDTSDGDDGEEGEDDDDADTGDDREEDDGTNAEGDYNHDDDPNDDDAEGAEDYAGVDDPEGYGDNVVGRDEEGNGGHASIRDKESGEPLPKDLPGQGITPTGAGKPGHEPGAAGKYRIQRRMKAGRMPIKAVDNLIRKYDSYSVYLSGGMTLKEVLEDGLSDGIPPGVSEVFQSLYKAVGNTLKSAKGDSVNAEITAISGEFSDAVVALHSVWKGLLKTGTSAQKKAAKKWMADIDMQGGLQTFANTAVATAKKQAKPAAPAPKPQPKQQTTKSSNVIGLDAIQKAVAKAVAPLQAELASTKKQLAQLKKPAPARKGLGSDDLEHDVDAEAVRLRKEEEDDEAFIRDRSRKGLFGTTRG